jgi:predicted transcriptional regulator
MDLDFLKSLNLPPAELNVYKSLLQFGQSGVAQLLKKTGIERRYIYDLLNKLIEKGLASYIEENHRKKYQATHPQKIMSYIDDKKKILSDIEKEIEPHMEELTELFNNPKTQVTAQVYRGSEGIKSLLNEILEYKKSYWLGGNNFNQLKNIPQPLVVWFNHWMERRKKQKHLMHDLVDPGTVINGVYLDDIKKQKEHYLKARGLPKDLKSPMVIIIFGNKVAQILWSQQSFAFVMESEEIHQSFMKYFNYFWEDPWKK